jgi:hypothetical protein
MYIMLIEPDARWVHCRCGLECKDLAEVHHSEAALTAQQAERIVGWALSNRLSSGTDVALPSRGASTSPAAPVVLPSACLQAALVTHTSAQVERLTTLSTC